MSSRDPTVEISEEGRSGHVRYREAAGELSFYWELGGGDTVATVFVGTAADWNERHAWAAGRRAAIVRFIAAEVIRQQAPTCRAEIDDDAGFVHLKQASSASAHAATAGGFHEAGSALDRATNHVGSHRVSTAPAGAASPAAKAAGFVTRLRRIRSAFATVVFVVAAAGAALLWLSEKLLSIDPGKGTSVGATVRTDRHVATLIQSLEPYIPSLHRDHSLDRYSLSMFLVPLDGSATGLVALRSGMTGSEIARARILGSDGQTMWYDADGTGGVDLQSLRPLDAGGLRTRTPPSSLLGPRPLPHANEPATCLAAGFLPAPDAWLGLHSDAELKRDYQTGKWVRRIVRADGTKDARRLYRAKLEPDSSGKYHRIVAITPVGSAQYVNAAFLRPRDDAEPISLPAPGGALMLYTSDAGLTGTAKLARIDAAGTLAWDIDTGIDRFRLAQILPGEHSTVFVGPRPPVPDRVSEPLLVIVDHASGKATTHSLWQ